MYVSSQSTYPKLVNDSLVVITPAQLKVTNLVFLEHKKLKLERVELTKQINSYELLTANYQKTDSLRLAQLERAKFQMELYNQALVSSNLQLEKMSKKSKRLTALSIGGCTLSVGLLLVLVLR